MDCCASDAELLDIYGNFLLPVVGALYSHVSGNKMENKLAGQLNTLASKWQSIAHCLDHLL